MENSFELLEERVRKTADLVKRLRRENKGLEEDLGKARVRLQEAEKRLESLERDKGPAVDHAKEIEGMSRDLRTLRQERDEVRNRIGKLVEVLDSLD